MPQRLTLLWSSGSKNPRLSMLKTTQDEPLFSVRALDADAGIRNPIIYQIINVTVEGEDFTDQFEIAVNQTDNNAIVR
jgi:hypothetical protein